jgi:hypothetical protein
MLASAWTALLAMTVATTAQMAASVIHPVLSVTGQVGKTACGVTLMPRFHSTIPANATTTGKGSAVNSIQVHVIRSALGV